MKRTAVSLLLAAALLLAGSGCRKAPKQTADGEPWSEDWVRVGASLGVEQSDNGFVLLDNKDALAVSGLYYAAWTDGDAVDYENEDGEVVDLYDAQLYLLLEEAASPEDAAASLEEWKTAAEETHPIQKTETITSAGQEFQILTYEYTAAENPYAFGGMALGVHGSSAICVELACREGYDREVKEILMEFLEGFHYAA